MAGIDPVLLQAIRDAGETLPGEVRRAVVARREEAVDDLLALTEEGGLAAEHAEDIYEAIAARIDLEAILEDAGYDEVDQEDFDEAVDCVDVLGPDAAEVLAAAYATRTAHGARRLVAELASDPPERDDRLFDLLIDYFAADPVEGAGMLATYGDPTALPELSAALDRALSASDSTHMVLPLFNAIETLGGKMTAYQLACVGRARTESEDLAERLIPTSEIEDAQPRPGRNDPCWCGSGKKYKKCHLALDENSLGDEETGGARGGE